VQPNLPAGAAPATKLAAEYFDGISARAHPVLLAWAGSALQIRGESIALDVAQRDVQWAERTFHGPRVAHLRDGGSLHCRDAAACDAWQRAAGRADSAVVRTQQSWRWAIASGFAVVLVLTAMAVWGVPWFSRGLVLAVPHSVDKSLGEATLATLDQHLLKPSLIDSDRQRAIRSEFARLAALQGTPGVAPYDIVFRRARIGPNAFALPGGTVVVTDEIVDLLDSDPNALSGVLAHELGHVQHRHGLRMVVQATALGLLASVVLGDFSSLAAAAPAVLGQASYSRDAEREADAHCAQFLKAAGVSPAVMVGVFEQLGAARSRAQRGRGGESDLDPETAKGGAKGSEAARESAAASEPSWLGIAIGSHPPDSQRIAFFRDSAR